MPQVWVPTGSRPRRGQCLPTGLHLEADREHCLGPTTRPTHLAHPSMDEGRPSWDRDQGSAISPTLHGRYARFPVAWMRKVSRRSNTPWMHARGSLRALVTRMRVCTGDVTNTPWLMCGARISATGEGTGRTATLRIPRYPVGLRHLGASTRWRRILLLVALSRADDFEEFESVCDRFAQHAVDLAYASSRNQRRTEARPSATTRWCGRTGGAAASYARARV